MGPFPNPVLIGVETKTNTTFKEGLRSIGKVRDWLTKYRATESAIHSKRSGLMINLPYSSSSHPPVEKGNVKKQKISDAGDHLVSNAKAFFNIFANKTNKY